MRRALLALAVAAGLAPPAAAEAARSTDTVVARMFHGWFATEWQRYAERFVTPDGRVVDNANGGVSHSEGQGYGLVLAARAEDAARFDRLWRWTADHLMVRPDGLAAWKWDPAAQAVTDMNNASDGDLLLAWGLWDGARRFNRPDYRTAAERIARALLAGVVVDHDGGPILLPGTTGFRAGEQPDGPVINLSYWVDPAFAALKDLAPEGPWDALKARGRALLDQSRFGPYGLPTEWEALGGGTPAPARNFPAVFGYNAIRVPLYVALDGGPGSRDVLRRFTGTWTEPATGARAVAFKAAAVTPPLENSAYGLVLAVARCAAAGEPIPPALLSTRADLYFPETLRLLSAIAIQERFPSCL